VVKYRTGKDRGVMAHAAILSGRQMITQHTDTDHIVVAIGAKCRGTNVTWTMTKGASAKGPRGMANTAILQGRHVFVERGGKRHAARRTRPICNMTGDATVTYDASMIDAKCRSETLGVMARSTIGCGYRVGGNRRRLGGRVNTGAIVVA